MAGILDDNGNYRFTGGPVGGDTQPGVGGGGSFTPDAFNQMINDASSFSVTIDSGTRNAIQWIAAKDRILIGTTGGEWRMSGHSNKPLTPFNYDLKPQTVWGSKDMQPLVLHDSVAFVDFVGKRLRELVWDGTNERYLSPDLMMLAEHITASGGVTTMAYQKRPDSIIWATLANGDLISCTYDKSQDVVAWARHPMSLGVDLDADPTLIYIPPVSTDYPLLRSTTDQDDLQLPHVMPISNIEELQAIGSATTGNYYLVNDIDASGTETWDGGSGFTPLSGLFRGTLDGCGYTISGLYIHRFDFVGLFTYLRSGARIANLTLADADFVGALNIGILCSDVSVNGTDNIIIQNVHVSGTIAGNIVGGLQDCGGLVGRCYLSASTGEIYIYDCSADVEIDMTYGDESYRGGFVGRATDIVTFKNCYATGDLINPSSDSVSYFGGFGGYLSKITCTYCYATGDVDGGETNQSIGGFAGTIIPDSTVSNCYATGNVVGYQIVGGFVGTIEGAGTDTITNCYARGTTTSHRTTTSIIGSFVGLTNGTGGNFTYCYGTGLITGDGGGGFLDTGDVNTINTDCYWDTETTGLATTYGDLATGHTTTWMKTKLNYPSTWDFDDVWYIVGTAPYINSTNSNGLGANSVCVIPSTTEDEVWISVGRVIGGERVGYIERMAPRNWGDDQADCFFVDSGLTYDGDATTTFTGLDHLEGETVAILGDGAVFPPQTVTNGTITLPEAVSKVHIGLPYTYKLKPMRMDQGYNGTSKGSIKKITEAVISFYKTLNARYGDGTDTYDIDWRETDAEYTTPPDLVTGDKVVVADGGFSVEDPFQIEGSDPLPCTVRAIIPRIEVTGR